MIPRLYSSFVILALQNINDIFNYLSDMVIYVLLRGLRDMHVSMLNPETHIIHKY